MEYVCATMTILEFIAKWRRVDLKERSASQEHFLDLCAVFEHPTPAAADPTGESFCFEKGAAKHGGGDGFADVWKRGAFGIEYKGKHKDLTAAYDQLLRYRSALENPPLLLVCDLDRIVIHTNFTGTVEVTYAIPLESLGEPRNIEIMRAVFHSPEALRPGRTSTAVTQDAARQIAEIADILRKRGNDPAAVAHFLDRIVFCLFAEDAGLLPDKVFSRILEKSGGDSARFVRFLEQLFETMATGGDFGLETIRHFNGSLFDDHNVLELSADDVKRFATTAALDWSAVDPSIFGTLFERGLDPAKRSQLGAHFTSRDDIELVVDAVMMSVLRGEWNETKAVIESLLTTGRKKPGGAGVPPALLARAGETPTSLVRAGETPAPPAKPPREWHNRGYLPHFDHPGLVQTITFRLADSLPPPLRERLQQTYGKQDDPELRKEIEAALDNGLGECHLRDPRVAEAVQNALLHFDGERYRLVAWTVMPNHVHAMIETVPGVRLDEIMHTWKSFTAKACNRILGRQGAFWQEDYFDRFIRDADHFARARRYIEENPVKAGLIKEPEAWVFGSAAKSGGAGVSPALNKQAGETPAPPGLSPTAKRKAQGEASSILHRFLDRLHHVKVLDPACGSGNFLYVALLRLKDLEKEVILYGSDNGLGAFLPLIGPWQLYGIEINPYAHDLAQMTVWIGWLQWIRANGFGFPADPVLRSLSENIRLMDAIVGSAGVPPALDAHAGETPAPPGEPEWPSVDFIIGNPPFLGGNRIRQELGGEYVDRIFALYDGRVPAFADLCCYWFEKARAQIAAGKCKRAGLLATQGIRGGANREVLKRIKDSGGIFWAESDRIWIQDGASVHVSMVGFDNGSETSHVLDGREVPAINPNLTSCVDITTAKTLTDNLGICFMGPSAKAPFDIDAETAAAMLADKGNPNGKPNADVVRPVISAVDIGQGSRGKWTIDFALMPIAEAAQYEKPFEYVRANVMPVRETRRDDYRGMWWQYARPRPEMRVALQNLSRYIATPGVSKHRLFVWVAPEVLCNQGTLVFARDDDAFFGILHSRIHEVWARAQGTQLREAESGCRYTPTTSFETFPLPGGAGVPPASRAKAAVHDDAGGTPAPPGFAAIAEAARDLVAKRDRWLAPEGMSAAERKKRTLTNLYNARPTWLADCHARLDAAVAAAYGWPADLPDDAILERLLALNQAQAGAT